MDDAATSAGVAGEAVDDAEEEVAGDVLEVASVTQPRASGRDVVGGALARRLEQHGKLEEVVPVPRGEGLEQLQAFAARIDLHLDAAAVLWRRQEALITGLEPPAGQGLALRLRQAYAVDFVG